MGAPCDYYIENTSCRQQYIKMYFKVKNDSSEDFYDEKLMLPSGCQCRSPVAPVIKKVDTVKN